MALSKLSGDEQGIILGQLWNPLEPRLAVYLSSANKELRLLLTPALRQQLRVPASAVAKVAPVCEARDTLLFASHLEEFGFESGSESDEIENEEGGD